MSTTKALEKNPRKQMGYIKIYNKSYPIYEGLNIIGRDLKASVRMTDLKFSKQHAVLSVVDETTHLISDFGSSNGTELRRNKLTPFKFYKINDCEPVVFGDIVAVYHKGTDPTQEEVNINATQSQLDHISSTQVMTENIHDASTQHCGDNQSPKIHNATKQIIHEAATQEINKTVNNIHDLNTQVLPGCSKFATTDVKSNYIDEDFGISRSEIYDDVFANESFRLSLQSGVSKYNIVVDESLPIDTKLDNSVTNKNNVSLDDDDIILSTQDNEMIENQTLELIQINKPNSETKQNDICKVTEPTTNNKSADDSGSETDIEDEEIIMKNLQQKSTQFNERKGNKSTKENLQNDSDSETDAEEDLLSKNINQEPTESDCDTEIEDNVLANLPICKNDESPKTKIEDIQTFNSHEEDNKTKVNNISFSDEEDELDLLAPTQKLQEVPVTQLLQNKTDENNEKDADDDIFLLAPTQLLQNNENQDDDLLLAPTQLLESKKPQNVSNQTQDDDDIDLLAPTQLLQSKSNENNKNQVPDEINDAPTQLLDSTNNKNNKQINDDDYLAPTQLLESKTKQNEELEVDDDDMAPTQLLQSNNDKNKVIDVDDLAPTQLLQNNKNEYVDVISASTIILEKSIPSTFSSPKKSSILSLKSPRNKEKRSVNFSENLIYDLPTQKLDISIEKPKQNVEKDDSIYTAPTQLLENKLNKTDDDIFSAETQPLTKNKSSLDLNVSTCSAINNLNTTQESLKLVLSETDDDSICETTKKQNLNNSETTMSKAVNIPEPETQLEVEFALETQKMYVEERTSRPDNPLGNIFAEEQTQMTEDITEIKTAENEVSKNDKPIVIETTKRLQVKLHNIKDISEASISKRSNESHSSTCDENDFKEEPSKTRRKKKNVVDTVAQNAQKLNITKVKNSEDTKNNNTKKNEPKNYSLVKSSETTEETKPHNTRGKRISSQKLNSKIETKRITRSTLPKNSLRDKSKTEDEVIKPKRSTREKPQNKLKTPKKEVDKNDNSSDLDDFINRVTRSAKRTNSTAETPKKKTKKEDHIEIEDSDDEIIDTMSKLMKKKVLKLQYTDSEVTTSNSSSSNSAFVRKHIPPKRSMKIEDYSSDETENSNATSICLNTPNTKRRKYEPLSVTISNTQNLNTSGESLKHKVVFTMLNDTSLEGSVKQLGGSIIDSVQSCTVLVTNKISRSLKFLVAIALGKPIVQPKWITDSIKQNSFRDPWNYLLEDKESETKFKFLLKDSLKKSVEKKLLTDVVILLATKKNTDVLKEIIETSGGKCIQRAPAKNGKAIVVSYEDERAKYSKYLKQKSLTVVSAEAIFSGVLLQELQWNQHLLS